MSKKILSVVLALVLVMTTFAVSAFAVGDYGYEEDNTKTQTWALENKRDNGDGTWSVDVRLTANYVVGAISFQVTNPDAEDGKLVGATLKSVTKGEALTYGANIQRNSTSGLVLIIPEPSSDSEKGVDLTNGGVIATLTFQLTADSADIAIKNDPKSATNKGGDLIAVRLSDENLTTATWIYGQTVTSVGDTVTLGAEQAADPVLKGVGTGFVDEERGYVYGVKAGDPIDENYFTVENGSFVMEENAKAVTNGTGSVLVVKDEAGNEYARYTLIIFGDVDGDGTIALADYGDVKFEALGKNVIVDPACEFAADVDGQDGIALADYGDVKFAAIGKAITVNPYAA